MILIRRRAALGAALLLTAPLLASPTPARAQATRLAQGLARAATTPGLRSLIVAQNGTPLAERAFAGGGLDRPANIKSASKTILAMLAGIALERGVLRDLDQTVAPLLAGRIPPDADPAVRQITLRHLLSMRAGLERTSGANYGAWVASRDWVRDALGRPMVDRPGGAMLYSTGTSHILGAALARASGRSLRDLAQDWLFEPLGHRVGDWARDPQGLHFGGNQMALSPRALLAFGECCRQGGRHEGRQIIPEAFLREAWVPQARSPWSGQSYGLGWWIAEARGQQVLYAWGYGGQMLYILPELGLTVVMISDPDVPRRSGQVQTRHALLVEEILPAFLEA
ncbi:serine hydrolase [Roseomonas frigidaquae]|uniref:Serine hydrolase n=1 Tax=Falsiroseomonas frigidaquae TaxID=487318 RepID=A0ABX1F0U0_9PROT|nr:serine hydrolase [Falsiroseomonas frigidaquae]NKE45944.1 serine hydrolase [Falsiroseomonas frigidaquae]